MPLGKRRDGRTVGPSSAQRSVTAKEIAAYPLRKVVSQGLGADPRYPNYDRDVLECGHSLGAAKDLVGRRWPAKRRCRKCAAGRPPDIAPDVLAALIREGGEGRFGA